MLFFNCNYLSAQSYTYQYDILLHVRAGASAATPVRYSITPELVLLLPTKNLDDSPTSRALCRGPLQFVNGLAR